MARWSLSFATVNSMEGEHEATCSWAWGLGALPRRGNPSARRFWRGEIPQRLLPRLAGYGDGPIWRTIFGISSRLGRASLVAVSFPNGGWCWHSFAGSGRAPSLLLYRPRLVVFENGPFARPHLPSRIVGVEVRTAERRPSAMRTAFNVAAVAMAFADRRTAIRAGFQLFAHASVPCSAARNLRYRLSSRPEPRSQPRLSSGRRAPRSRLV